MGYGKIVTHNVATTLKGNGMSEIRIVEWADNYHQAFIDLSVEWLEKYVSVEPADLEILYHPYESILNDGGEIFFALIDDSIAGTVAMIKSGNIFELAKLAVTEKYKGKKIGNLLMERCITFAKEKGAKRIILYTNHKLIPAICLYKKYGFCEVDIGNNKYIESDMKMELKLYGND